MEPAPAVAAMVPVHGDLEQRVRQLQEALAARELQLERKSGEVSQVQAVCDQLQVRRQQQSLHRVAKSGILFWSACCTKLARQGGNYIASQTRHPSLIHSTPNPRRQHADPCALHLFSC